MDRNSILVGIAVLGIVITGGLIYFNSNHGISFNFPTIFGASDNKIGLAAVDYINKNGLSSTPATFVSTSESYGLVAVKLKIGTQTFTSYTTKDGKMLFPQAIAMAPAAATTAAAATPSTAANTPASATPTATAANLQKVSKPSLEAFVVSSCPFGLQMQRAIVDAVKNVPSLASNITIRYIGNVDSNGKTIDSMHGPEEGAENLRQICIREEQPSKFYNYLGCYMQKTTATAASGMPLGDSTSCQASTGVDTGKLAACVADPSRGLAYAQKDFSEDTKYSVQGSPTLILDGATISESDFGGRSSDAMKTIICDASTSKPSFCSKTLNTTEAATSFNATYAAAASGSTGGTQCGS